MQPRDLDRAKQNIVKAKELADGSNVLMDGSWNDFYPEFHCRNGKSASPAVF